MDGPSVRRIRSDYRTMTALEGLEFGPVPTLLLARTEQVYVRPVVKDVTAVTPAAEADDD